MLSVNITYQRAKVKQIPGNPRPPPKAIAACPYGHETGHVKQLDSSGRGNVEQVRETRRCQLGVVWR
jgi:hypothetical protein